MKIGFAARWSPLDKNSWSGTCYHTYKELCKDFEVDIFVYKWPWHIRERLTAQKSFYKRIAGKQTSVEFLNLYAKYFSRQLEKDLKKRPVDILFVPGSPQLISYIKTTIPVVLMTDATFLQIQGYYPYFSNLSAKNIREGIELDKKAFLNASHCMLASDWCKNSARKDYGVPEKNISVIPLGANMENIPAISELAFSRTDTCRLLFLGVEWDRKGGDIVLETFRLLKQKRINAHLHIIGCIPPVDISAEKNITNIPFLDKNDEEGSRQLHDIFLKTDLLFLPARAECAGVVFSEASAYGIPSITTDTGGVTTYVKEGVNGYALSLSEGADAYAGIISKLATGKIQLENLKISSRRYYDSQLNWSLWGNRFRKVAETLIKQKK
jgi:glycosyltransferase involved in cell wall biosynthesis